MNISVQVKLNNIHFPFLQENNVISTVLDVMLKKFPIRIKIPNSMFKGPI